MAVNCCIEPRAMVGLVGFTKMDTSTTGVTVSVAELVTPSDVAVSVVVPVETEVASPLDPAALLMVATVVDDELQIADTVTFCVVLSEKVPVAVNCSIVPKAMLGLIGVTAIDTSVADVTVNWVVLDMFVAGSVAVSVVEPVATDVANPLDSVALLMVQTVVDDELQIADVVKFCVVLSEKNPMAVNCCVVSGAIRGLVGVTEMNMSTAGVTFSVVEPDTLPDVAVIVAGPVATDVAVPLDPAALLMVATFVDDELQIADVVKFCVVLSE